MLEPGLVSISFREHRPDTIAAYAAECGLKYIEWGSDIHAPYQDESKLALIASIQKNFGISCCSYGTYFRLGFTPIEELHQYIRSAKILGTNMLRLWAGRKKASDCTKADQDYLFDQCRQAAALAEAHDVVLALECHRRSYTETKEGALELMQAVNSPNFRMYWQPNPDISLSDNLEYIAALKDYITHIHVFHWTPEQRLPLKRGIEPWTQYLDALSGDHHLLLEFMPNDRIESLPEEAGALLRLIQQK